MSTNDRRGFLCQLAGLPLIGGSTLPVANTIEADLSAGITRMVVLRREHDDAMAHDDAMKDVYFEGRPARPDILRQMIHGIPARGCEYEIVAEQGNRFGALTRGSLQQLKTAPSYATGRCIDDGDEVIPHGGDQAPMSAKAKSAWADEDYRATKKIAKVILAYDEWDARCDAWKEACGYKATQQAYDDASDAYFAEMERLLALPATTVVACSMKARLLLEHDADGGNVYFAEFVKQLAEVIPSAGLGDVDV